MLQEFGIDVSQYQGKIDWDKVKTEGIQFAILRIGYTNNSTSKRHYKDTKFDYNYEECKRLGIKVGIYYRSAAISYEEGRYDAQLVLDWMKGKSLEIGIFTDIEDKFFNENDSKSQITDGAKGFCDLLRANNWIAGVYSNVNFLKERVDMSQLEDYELWCASWSTVKPTVIREEYGIWQFGGERNPIRDNHLDGITANVVDMDYLYQDYLSIAKEKGLNGYPREEVSQDITLDSVIENIETSQENVYVPNIETDTVEDEIIIEEEVIETDAVEKEQIVNENILKEYEEKKKNSVVYKISMFIDTFIKAIKDLIAKINDWVKEDEKEIEDNEENNEMVHKG